MEFEQMTWNVKSVDCASTSSRMSFTRLKWKLWALCIIIEAMFLKKCTYINTFGIFFFPRVVEEHCVWGEMVWEFGKQSYLLSCQENECSYSICMLNMRLLLAWLAILALHRGYKTCLPAPLKLSYQYVDQHLAGNNNLCKLCGALLS